MITAQRETSQSGVLAWKLWPLTRLLNPGSTFGWGPLTSEGSTFFACCSHGNSPPAATCGCGLHYLVDGSAFFRSSTVRETYRRLHRSVVVSVGEPVGDRLPDRDDGDDLRKGWGGERPSRAAGFTIRGLIVSTALPGTGHVVRNLRYRYAVPVVVARWDDRSAGAKLLNALAQNG